MIDIAELFDTAFASLWRNKLRSVLTMLGIIIGVASVILLVSIGAGLQSFVTQQFESLGANLIFVTPGNIQSGGQPSATALKMGMREVRALRRAGYPITKVSGVYRTAATTKFASTEQKSTIILGTEVTGFELLNLEADSGQAFSQGDLEKNARVAYLGPAIAEKLFKNTNPVGKSFFIQSSKYRVVGTFKSKGGGSGLGDSFDDMVVIPITTAWKQFNQDKVLGIYVQAANKDEIEAAKKKVEAILLKTLEPDDFSVLGQEDLLKTINQILGVISAGLGGIAAISLVVGGIGIMNIMFVTVTERTKEIGLRKALGATPNNILIQFLIESITVSVVGGSIGILLALTGSLILNQYLSSAVTPFAVILAFGFSSLIGVIFGVIPAWKAAKMDPIKALRYE